MHAEHADNSEMNVLSERASAVQRRLAIKRAGYGR